MVVSSEALGPGSVLVSRGRNILTYLLTYLLVKDATCEVFADVACPDFTRTCN